MATLVAYDPDWARWFDQESAALIEALGPEVIAVEHVGSTAVPQLRARPILDVAVGLRDAQPSPRQLAALRRLGYQAPRCRPHRSYVTRGRPRTVTVHLMQWGVPRWFRLLAFRDALRADPDMRARYGELKASLCDGDPGRYSAAKRRFISSEMRHARRTRTIDTNDLPPGVEPSRRL